MQVRAFLAIVVDPSSVTVYPDSDSTINPLSIELHKHVLLHLQDAYLHYLDNVDENLKIFGFLSHYSMYPHL